MTRASHWWAPVSCLAISIALATPATGQAHDGLAPPGGRHTWLPSEEWLDHHWIPFDKQGLKRALGLRGRDLESYLYDDHHTLADLARLRGIEPDELADRLTVPWLQTAEHDQLARLRDHTLRILTQGHLAQHAFFHGFHGFWVEGTAPSIFGLSEHEYWRLRRQGRTPLSIARRGGVSSAAVRKRMIRRFRADHDTGIRLGLAWAPESDRILRRQVRELPCWLRRPIAPYDAANPYGKARRLHGDHSREWPTTPEERHYDERRVELFRRSLPASCWRSPPAWNWPAHGVRGSIPWLMWGQSVPPMSGSTPFPRDQLELLRFTSPIWG